MKYLIILICIFLKLIVCQIWNLPYVLHHNTLNYTIIPKTSTNLNDISFDAFNRKFQLILYVDHQEMAPDIKILSNFGNNQTTFHNDIEFLFYSGYVKGDKYSRVEGNIIDGVFSGRILLSSFESLPLLLLSKGPNDYYDLPNFLPTTSRQQRNKMSTNFTANLNIIPFLDDYIDDDNDNKADDLFFSQTSPPYSQIEGDKFPFPNNNHHHGGGKISQDIIDLYVGPKELYIERIVNLRDNNNNIPPDHGSKTSLPHPPFFHSVIYFAEHTKDFNGAHTLNHHSHSADATISTTTTTTTTKEHRNLVSKDSFITAPDQLQRQFNRSGEDLKADDLVIISNSLDHLGTPISSSHHLDNSINHYYVDSTISHSTKSHQGQLQEEHFHDSWCGLSNNHIREWMMSHFNAPSHPQQRPASDLVEKDRQLAKTNSSTINHYRNFKNRVIKAKISKIESTNITMLRKNNSKGHHTRPHREKRQASLSEVFSLWTPPKRPHTSSPSSTRYRHSGQDPLRQRRPPFSGAPPFLNISPRHGAVVLTSRIGAGGPETKDGMNKDDSTSRGKDDDNSRIKRPLIPDKNTCSLFIQTDTFLWNHISKKLNTKDKRRIREEIISMISSHIKAVNHIYGSTNFGDYAGIQFVVQRIKILEDTYCENVIDHKQSQYCNPNLDVSNVLNLWSLENHDDFCLAYLWTYRDFIGGTLGLAWVAAADRESGGICESFKLYPKTESNQVPVYKSLNTGIITFVNYGAPVSPRVTHLTKAHEIGHNFGSPHDYPAPCRPGQALANRNGNFIMFSSATSGDKVHNDKFSPCSKHNISAILEAILKEKHGKSNCFIKNDGAFCGNGLREEGEECDCGYPEDCLENGEIACCHPRTEDSSKSCKRKDGVMCSPSEGPCCTKQCKHVTSDTLCASSTECSFNSFCTGITAECPEPRHRDNRTTACNDNTQVCWQGHCLGSICEKFNLEQCFITAPRDAKQFDRGKLCQLACQIIDRPETCKSSFDYPALRMINNGTGINLKPGSPCNNYQGYCDVFLKCREVSEGPLTRLKNLIFNTHTFDLLKNWIIEHWWVVSLMGLFLLLFMGFFIKFCAVHTPSSNPKKPPARSFSDTMSRTANTIRRTSHHVMQSASTLKRMSSHTHVNQSSSTEMPIGRIRVIGSENRLKMKHIKNGGPAHKAINRRAKSSSSSNLNSNNNNNNNHNLGRSGHNQYNRQQEYNSNKDGGIKQKNNDRNGAQRKIVRSERQNIQNHQQRLQQENEEAPRYYSEPPLSGNEFGGGRSRNTSNKLQQIKSKSIAAAPLSNSGNNVPKKVKKQGKMPVNQVNPVGDNAMFQQQHHRYIKNIQPPCNDPPNAMNGNEQTNIFFKSRTSTNNAFEGSDSNFDNLAKNVKGRRDSSNHNDKMYHPIPPPIETIPTLGNMQQQPPSYDNAILMTTTTHVSSPLTSPTKTPPSHQFHHLAAGHHSRHPPNSTASADPISRPSAPPLEEGASNTNYPLLLGGPLFGISDNHHNNGHHLLTKIPKGGYGKNRGFYHHHTSKLNQHLPTPSSSHASSQSPFTNNKKQQHKNKKKGKKKASG